MVLEKNLESTLDCKEINQSILKEISLEYSLEGLMLKLKHFGHLLRRADSLERTLMLGKIEGRRRRGASGPISSWQINGETMETVRDYFLELQNHCRC